MQPLPTPDPSLPEPTLKEHSFFELNAGAVRAWADALPKANLGETSKQLYLAVRQLNQVACRPAERLDALENIRPALHLAQNGMQRHYLNKAFVLPPNAHKVVQLSDFLNEQLALGYRLVATQLSEGGRSTQAELALATHRAITEYSRMLLRRYQLYSDPQPGFWLMLHKLFQIAVINQLSGQRMDDPLFGSCNLTQAYLRPLLLACARPHQLQQADLPRVFQQFASWSDKLALRGGELDSCAFIVSPTADRPPQYRELCTDRSRCLGIDTGELCRHLGALQKHARDTSDALVDDSEINSQLLSHLQQAWGQMSQRASERSDCDTRVVVALGLVAAHFFVADQTPFEAFSGDNEAATGGNPFLQRRRDVWSDSLKRDVFDRGNKTPGGPNDDYDVIDFTSPGAAAKAEDSGCRHHSYAVIAVNASDRGYCIQWPSNQAVQLKSGNLIALKSNGAPHWSLGCIRWVKNVSTDYSQVGIEVLGDSAEPFSASALHLGLPGKHSHRSFLLPPDPLADTPGYLLAPRTAFKAGQTLELRQPGQVLRAQLTARAASASTFCLFQYKPLKTETKFEKEQETSDHRSASFDSLWDQL